MTSSTSLKITNNNISKTNRSTLLSFSGVPFAGIRVSGASGIKNNCVISSNHIFSSDQSYTNGIVTEQQISSIISDNEINGFSTNGIFVEKKSNDIGIISNNIISRNDDSTISSFISGSAPIFLGPFSSANTSSALVCGNYFSHETIDGSNWQNSVLFRGSNWVVEENKNQQEEVVVTAASGNVYNPKYISININPSDDSLKLSGGIADNTNSYLVGTNVRCSVLYRNESDPSGVYQLYYFDNQADPDVPGVDDAFVVDNAITDLKISASPPDPTAPFTINELITTSSSVNRNATLPFIYQPGFDWLTQTIVADQIKQKIDPNNPNYTKLYCKIIGTSNGYDGIYEIKTTQQIGSPYRVSLYLQYLENTNTTDQVIWAVNSFELFGNNKEVKKVDLLVSPTNNGKVGSAKISFKGIENTITNVTSATTASIEPDRRNASNNNIKATVTGLSGSANLKMTVRYKW